MSEHIVMPALSPTMEKGALARWMIEPGEAFKAGDVIAEVETDKATMEVEATGDGVLAEILVPAGTEDVPVNTPIARLGPNIVASPGAPEVEPEGASASAATSPTDPPILSPAAKRIVAENALDLAELDRTGRNGRVTKGDALAAASCNDVPPVPAPEVRPGVDISPLARRIAQQLDVDIGAIRGSGPGGRILKADLVAPSSTVAPAKAPAPAEARPVPSLEQLGLAPGGHDLIPLDGMRKTIARRMTDSFRDVPHFPLTIDVELDALLAARARINQVLEKDGIKASVNDMVIKAAAVALKRVPDANASYTPEGIAMHHHADIAMAVAVPGGLITPVIHAAEAKGLAQIATEAKDLAERARHRKLKPEEFQGGTFSVSNLGMFGIRTFASILNEPQGCILSVGMGEKRPVARGDDLAVATVMSVTLTCDHRVVDGAVGARFLQVLRGLLEDPMGMLT